MTLFVEGLYPTTSNLDILDDDRLIISVGFDTSQVDKVTGAVTTYGQITFPSYVYYPGFNPLPACVSRKRAIDSDEERIRLLHR
mmetsp:Transcript_28035/g.31166  ORF Transcript_28035/g.31166 Transcript_28035/m.31166 type:complete len:84 (-) Transcript_28035:53-304(-)